MLSLQCLGTLSQELPKHVGAFAARSGNGTDDNIFIKEGPQLVGHTNEVNILLENIATTTLLDTGSCVSLVSESFYLNNFKHIVLQPLTQILHIECADGKKLNYLGFIQIELSVEQGLPNSSSLHCLFLVAPDTSYSSKTPVILGTNILSELSKECRDHYGPQFLQRASLHTPWYLSFRC